MRILFLSPRQAVPTRSGAKLREFHFLRALGLRSEVTYLYFSDPGAAPLTVAELPFCQAVVPAPKPPAYGLAKTIEGLVTRWPLPILNYTSAAMSEAVRRVTDAGEFDIIHLDSIHMIRYALEATSRHPSLRAIYNWHNIESEAMRRFSETSRPPKSWYAALTARKIRTLERSILESAFGHVVCSEREREQLNAIVPAARVAVIGNGVDTRYFADAGGELSERRRIVFVGAMDYFPNADGAVFFANQIWPAVRKRLGNVELVIVGANPGPAVKALQELPGITVTGTVPDVRPYYHDALAAIVPLRTGGGTRLKILEAMAAGVPVVSTPLGAEGLDVTDGTDALIVDAGDPEGWVERLAGLAESPARRQELIRAGLHVVETRYDWELLGAKLRETYEGWLTTKA